MPKKYRQKSLLTKPASSVSPSLALSRSSTPTQHEDAQKSVNELIHESRKGQGLPSRVHPVQSSSSLPPSLRAVLDIPAPAPPPHRHGTRGPSRLRRIPGPPPPPSWLNNSAHAPSKAKISKDRSIDAQLRIARNASILPEANFPRSRSLQHLLLKSMARSWEWHVQYDHSYLSELPVDMKQVLLSYIAIYGEQTVTNPVKVLFPPDIDEDEIGRIRRLDLGNAIGCWSTVRGIGKELFINPKQPRAATFALQPEDSVPDTWDQEESEDGNSLPAISSLSLATYLRFQNLKHLSLAAMPGASAPAASWQDLLHLASKLPTITSISLAYWPQPTYTPNASKGRYKVTASDSGSSPSVIYGGSDFYTAFDNNWREAAGILRTLSRSLYCLKWLDLTGCAEWFPALTWQPEPNEDESASTGPDWNGSWRGLDHLVLAIGWKPTMSVTRPRISVGQDNEDLSMSNRDEFVFEQEAELPIQPLPSRPALSLTSQAGEILPWDVEEERGKFHHRREVEKYMKLWNCAKKIAQDLRIIRKESGRGWIQVDFGEQDDIDFEAK